MKALLNFLNSNFGVLISGAIISGLFVQYITSSWQQRSWIFQQRYTAEKATFDRELDQKYQLLENINTAVAAILAGEKKGDEGKNRAIHAYDGIVWNIRSGFLTLLFGGWSILLTGIVQTKDKSPADYQALAWGTLKGPGLA
jgi:hypothetical protein